MQMRCKCRCNFLIYEIASFECNIRNMMQFIHDIIDIIEVNAKRCSLLYESYVCTDAVRLGCVRQYVE